MQKSKHNALQHLWIDGAEIQVYNAHAYSEQDKIWTTIPRGYVWSENLEYRVKPEKVYPTTLIANDELIDIYDNIDNSFSDALQAVANAAIKHAIDSGQVIINPGRE